MSGIIGFFQLDGSPADRRLLDKMVRGMAHRGPDGSGSYVDGPVAMGHLALNITPESVSEHQPLVLPGAGLVITSDARLDNREELFEALGVVGVDRKMPDSEIILRAYQKWGLESPQRLLGDFAFAIWNPEKQEIFCARDQFGVREFYYHVSPQRFIFASELKSILTVPGVPRRMDELKLACRLGFVPAFRERTLYEGILRLPPAHTLSIRKSGQPHLRRYWSMVMGQELRLGSDRDYAEALRELMFAAVRARIRSPYPIASTLSGGLDSSALACIAARELALRGQELLAVSNAVENHPDPEREEHTFVQSVLEQYGNIRIAWALGKKYSVLKLDQEHLDRFPEPIEGAYYYRTRELAEIASAAGARILLEGVGGDMAASFNGVGFLNQLARRGRWFELSRQLRAQSQTRRLAIKSILKTEVLRPLSPEWLRNLHDLRRLGKRAVWWGTPINPEFAERVGLQQLRRELGLLTDLQPDLRIFLTHSLNRGDEYGPNWGGAFFPTLQAVHPLCDRRIWEFCYRVPLNQFILDGMPRSLFRRAMHGILPEAILNRTSKGWFAPDFRIRLLERKNEVLAFLSKYDSSNPIWEYVNRPAIEEWLRRTEAGWQKGVWDGGAQMVVVTGIEMADFLLRLSENP